MIKEFLKSREFTWLNIFVRDFLLIFVVIIIHIKTNFNSRWVWFIIGMLVVYVSWQITDYINYKKLYYKKGA